MLWFDLRVGDRIRIGDDVVLRVGEKSGNVVRVSIEAPRAIDLKRMPREASVAPQPLRLRDREIVP